ncbi:porin family protein [Photobacterium sp. SDRW27]|uniref:outer membrane protein n=1 Tax=Photobacterium obscurum TaxID=2829490 RepID=UPI002243151A|nr:outer membrane beta-barrel protein [Photobacterium obscurum]MCW8328416.1 porin family protein [Photobacterium obscurum]
MDKTNKVVALLAALLPLTSMAEAKSISENTKPTEAPMRYFVGIKGGFSQVSNSDRVQLSNGDKLEASTTDHEGFAGLDIGIYTPGGHSRVYYSYERHTSESMFSGTPAYETTANMNLLSADYLFRHQDSVTPFVGLHIGYASVEPESSFPDGFEVSGVVFGLQAGIGWTVTEQFGFDLGMRHSILPSDIKTWDGVDNDGNSVTFESQQNGVTSFYASVNYRF